MFRPSLNKRPRLLPYRLFPTNDNEPVPHPLPLVLKTKSPLTLIHPLDLEDPKSLPTNQDLLSPGLLPTTIPVLKTTVDILPSATASHWLPHLPDLGILSHKPNVGKKIIDSISKATSSITKKLDGVPSNLISLDLDVLNGVNTVLDLLNPIESTVYRNLDVLLKSTKAGRQEMFRLVKEVVQTWLVHLLQSKISQLHFLTLLSSIRNYLLSIPKGCKLSDILSTLNEMHLLHSFGAMDQPGVAKPDIAMPKLPKPTGKKVKTLGGITTMDKIPLSSTILDQPPLISNLSYDGWIDIPAKPLLKEDSSISPLPPVTLPIASIRSKRSRTRNLLNSDNCVDESTIFLNSSNKKQKLSPSKMESQSQNSSLMSSLPSNPLPVLQTLDALGVETEVLLNVKEVDPLSKAYLQSIPPNSFTTLEEHLIPYRDTVTQMLSDFPITHPESMEIEAMDSTVQALGLGKSLIHFWFCEGCQLPFDDRHCFGADPHCPLCRSDLEEYWDEYSSSSSPVDYREEDNPPREHLFGADTGHPDHEWFKQPQSPSFAHLPPFTYEVKKD